VNLLRCVPTPADCVAGIQGTGMLMRVRWRMVRGVGPKVSVVVGVAMMFLALYLCANLGGMVRTIAEEGTGSDASMYAVNFIVSLERGQIGAFGALVLGSVVATALFFSLTGVGGGSFFTAPELVGIRPHRLHRYFDTLVVQAVSTVGVFQLVALTALGSLMTLDGQRGPGFLIVWAMWPMVAALEVMVAWAIELAQRVYGPVARRVAVTVLGCGAGIALFLDPMHGQTLFGAGDLFASGIRKATLGHWTDALPVFTFTMVLTALFVIVGLTLTQAALLKPVIPLPAPRSYRRWKISTNPMFALTQILLLQVVRTGAIRRPILAVAMVAPPAVLLSHGSFTVLLTLVVTIPMCVCLAWGVNIFGVIGPGMTWLTVQPNVNRMILGIAVAVQLFMITVLSVGVWGPATMFGIIDSRTAGSVAAATVVAALITTRSAAAKSVLRPYHVNVSQRGDQIIPTLTSINYTLRLVLGGGLVGILVLTVQSLPYQLGTVAGVAIWTTYRFIKLAQYWASRSVQARIVAVVAA
jgi:hypothetical protein